jgi:hypothetical protein
MLYMASRGEYVLFGGRDSTLLLCVQSMGSGVPTLPQSAPHVFRDSGVGLGEEAVFSGWKEMILIGIVSMISYDMIWKDR